MKKHIPFSLLMLFSFFFWEGEARAQQYAYRNYSLEHGLPQSEVFNNCLIVDDKGVLWAGTNGGGLARFEGGRFVVVNPQNAFPNNVVDGVYQRANGEMLVSFTNKGIWKYDGFAAEQIMDADGLLSQYVGGRGAAPNQFLENTQGDFAVHVLLNQGFKLFVEVGGKLKDADSLFPELADNPLLFCAFNNRRSIYLNTANGPFVLSQNKLTALQLSGIPPEQMRKLAVLFEDRQKGIWFRALPGYPDQGNVLFLYSGGGLQTVALPNGFLKNNISQILEDANGGIWVSSQGNGVFKYQPGKNRYFNEKNGLKTNNVPAMALDLEGNVWASLRGVGLAIMPDGRFENYGKSEGLQESIVFGVGQDSKKNIWLGTASQGIAKISPEGRLEVPQAMQPFFNTNILTRVDYFFEEADGKLLFTSAGGLFRYDGNRALAVSQEFGLPPAQFHQIAERDGRFWFAMANSGLGIYDPQTKQTQLLTPAEGLVNNTVRAFEWDKKGNLWIATVAGISKYDGKTFENYTLANGLAGLIHIDLCITQDGSVWSAGFDKGLTRFKDGKIFNYNEKDGFTSGIAYSLVEDDQGHLWVGGQKGLDKLVFSKDGTFKVQNFNAQDGFMGREMNGGASFKDADGNLWFGHIDGADKVNLSSDFAPLPKPTTTLNGLDLFLTPTSWQDSALLMYHSGVEAYTHIPKNLLLPYHKNHITFRFSSSSHKNIDKVRYQWKLESLDEDWLPPSQNREATYAGIPYGDYAFVVRSSNADGLWGDETIYKFTIQAPVWQRWWFKLLGLSAIAGVVFMGMRFRLRMAEAKRLELEKLVALRTAELSKRTEEVLLKNAELEQQKEEILAQHEEIEHKNMALETAYESIKEQSGNIQASINYARRIQDAMFPLLSEINKALPRSFILYKPRDVVSGDFYWFAETEHVCIIAAADCTGHGVPGAFMSLVSIDLLYHIVKSKEILEPGLILDELHIRIKKSLKQDQTRNQDGMDIALCALHKNAGKMYYAGAKNPLLLIENGQEQVFKADKLSIGGARGIEKFYYTTHCIDLSPEMTFYIYSDGFQDQFGGEQERKYLSKQFRGYLGRISALPMEEQKTALEKEFEQWRGAHKQIDDVLVIGFKAV